jgi:pellino protein
MSANGPNDEWTGAVIEFLKESLPVASRSPLTWSDDSMTAYQHGCDALVALGQAERFGPGALARDRPDLPETLPRWDDICVTVLRLAHVRFLRAGAPTPPGRYQPVRAAPDANIAAYKTVDAAHANAAALPILAALGLTENGQWTPASETIHWRNADGWKPSHLQDVRFIEAVEMACEAMPDDIDDEMDRLVTITDDDVERSAALIRKVRDRNYANAKEGGKAVEPPKILPPEIELARARASVENRRSDELDWLFYRRWRLSDNWLADEETGRALEIFHDRLAQNMRRAVISKRYDGLVMAELGWKPLHQSSAS